MLPVDLRICFADCFAVDFLVALDAFEVFFLHLTQNVLLVLVEFRNLLLGFGNGGVDGVDPLGVIGMHVQQIRDQKCGVLGIFEKEKRLVPLNYSTFPRRLLSDDRRVVASLLGDMFGDQLW